MKKIAILSGKGGTGKTLVAVSLSKALATGRYIDLLDCDVEEPNCNIFFSNKYNKKIPVELPTPVFNNSICVKCGLCVQQCKFNAIALIKNELLFFEENCRNCGLCSYLCPVNAITENSVAKGNIKIQSKNNITLKTGTLNIKQQAGFSVVMQLKKLKSQNNVSIIDCPPGASTNLFYSISSVDYCIIVTEPTIFGLHDLELVIEAVKLADIPFGIIINKYDYGMNIIDDYCRQNNYNLILKIPYKNQIAENYSKGIPLCDYDSKYYMVFKNLYKKILTKI
jgi:MinD superfamily P-loop ATPase